MEELMTVSRTMVNDLKQPEILVAKALAEWALPGDSYDDRVGRFKRSGLSLDPFLDLVAHASEKPQCCTSMDFRHCA